MRNKWKCRKTMQCCIKGTREFKTLKAMIKLTDFQKVRQNGVDHKNWRNWRESIACRLPLKRH